MTGAAAALRRANLYLVAPPKPTEWVERVARAGVGMLQLRDKYAEASSLLEVGGGWLQVARPRGVPLVVDDRPDVARALDADGVHLGQRDLPTGDARAIVGPVRLIGLSTHSREQVDEAVRQGEVGLVDYFAVGPVWVTPTVPSYAAVGLGLLSYAARHAGDMPWFAIGGIDAANVARVVEAGARRVVVVRAVVDATDPESSVGELLEHLPPL